MSTRTTNLGLIKPELSDVANITDFNQNWDILDEEVSKGSGLPVTAESIDGVNYTATVENVTTLYNGLTITVIPNMTSTSTTIKLNLNGLGAKNVRMTLPFSSGNSGALPTITGWFSADAPMTLRYHEKMDTWKSDLQRQSAQSLYGSVPVQNGGLAIDSNSTEEDKAEALANLQAIGMNNYTKVTATFNGLGWNSQSDGTYLQTVTVTGVTANSNVLVAPQTEYIDTYTCMGCKAISVGTNSITFSCVKPQDINMVINVMILNTNGSTSGSIFNTCVPIMNYGTTDMTAGTTALTTGHIYLVYE